MLGLGLGPCLRRRHTAIARAIATPCLVEEVISNFKFQDLGLPDLVEEVARRSQLAWRVASTARAKNSPGSGSPKS